MRTPYFRAAVLLVGVAFPTFASASTRGDFLGTGHAQLAVYRPSTSQWFIQGMDAVTWGLPSDIPVPGDYDGDGKTDIAVYRRATGQWFIRGQNAVTWGALGDIPVPADYDGDGRTDVAVFRPSTGQWIVYGHAPVTLGGPGDVPVPGDYRGLGHAQFAVFRSGTWLVEGLSPIAWGTLGDIPVPDDYDGDGTTDVAVYRPTTKAFFVRNGVTVDLSRVGDYTGAEFDQLQVSLMPLSLDLDGDGCAELIFADVYTFSLGPGPVTWQWSSYNPRTGGHKYFLWGTPGDIPVYLAALLRTTVNYASGGLQDTRMFLDPFFSSMQSLPPNVVPVPGYYGDIPRNGLQRATARGEFAVFLDGDWLFPSNDGCYAAGPCTPVHWGAAGDVPVPADYDGDGRTDSAVFRNGTWFVLLSSSSFTRSATFTLGAQGDVTLPGDYDGDGRADPAVFRDGVWQILLSSSDYSQSVQYLWGTAGDVPVPADYDGDRVLDLAVFRPAEGAWFVRQSSDGQSLTMPWGQILNGTVAQPGIGDIDGDGKADFIVAYAPGALQNFPIEWWVLLSSSNYAASRRIVSYYPPAGYPLPPKP